jgi:hypothetical protein
MASFNSCFVVGLNPKTIPGKSVRMRKSMVLWSWGRGRVPREVVETQPDGKVESDGGLEVRFYSKYG